MQGHNKGLSFDLLGNYPFHYIAFVGSNKRLDEANFDVKTMKIEKWGWSKSKTKDKNEEKHIFLIIASFWVYYLLNGFLHKGASQFGECQ